MELKKEDLRGTPLKERDFRAGKVLTVEWEPDLRYAWDDGVGIGAYLAKMKEGQITGSRCEPVRPRSDCPNRPAMTARRTSGSAIDTDIFQRLPISALARLVTVLHKDCSCVSVHTPSQSDTIKTWI